MDNPSELTRPKPPNTALKPQLLKPIAANRVILPSQKKKIEPLGYFQAIGVISGQVNFETREINLEDNIYKLFYAPKHKTIFDLMQKQAIASESNLFRLLVYPRVVHFPKREQEHKMSFQVVSFEGEDKENRGSGIFGSGEDNERGSGRKRGAFAQFKAFEFRLNGLWQFIPVCKTPVITIQRNFTDDRLKHIRESDSLRRVRFLKASHIPLLWRDAPKPFRFNPKSDTNDRAKFVEVTATFNPGRNIFYCINQIKVSEDVPRSLRALKGDKAAALQMVMKSKVS